LSLHGCIGIEQLLMPNDRRALAAIGLLILSLAWNLWAAPDPVVRTNSSYVIDVWDNEDGLPQNEITSILQTQDGYLWLGTPTEGLVRFDGVRFSVLDENNTPTLKSSRIVHLFEDSQRRLWIGTGNQGAVFLRDGHVVDVGIGRGSPNATLTGACQDPSGAVWLYLANGQLWRYQDGHTNLFLFGADQPTKYRNVIWDPSGSVWIGTSGRLGAVNWKAARQSEALPLLPEQVLPANSTLSLLLASRTGGYWCLLNDRIQKWQNEESELDWGIWLRPDVSGLPALVSAACEDREGHLVLGTLGAGLFWFDSAGNPTGISTSQGLSYNYINALYVDRDGNLWVATDGGGLNRVKRSPFSILEPARNLVVNSVSEDAEGGVWIGYNRHPVTYWKAGIAQNFDQGRFDRYVRSVLADRQQRVWAAGTRGLGLLQLARDTSQPLNPAVDKFQSANPTLNADIRALHQDALGRLWVGTERGLAYWNDQEWKYFTTKDGLSSESILSLADDPKGNLWIGTEGGGLNQFRDGHFTVYRQTTNGLPSDDISSLCVDGQGVLWIGTEGGGLARWNGTQWTRYSRRDGLVSNTIGYLLDDGMDSLWIGSNAGLMRIFKTALNDFADGRTNLVACRVYGRADGLPTRECTPRSQPGPCRGRDGTLWFPTTKGLVSVQRSALQPNLRPPPVMIDAVLIDGQIQERLREELTIPAGRERLEIHYSSLNLSGPKRGQVDSTWGHRYRYRLENHQTTWTDAGETPVAHYNNLPSGHYRFEVTACNEDGVWNPTGATLAFQVVPPFWRTWWFLGTTAVCLLGLVGGLVHYVSTQRLQRQLALLKQQEALERERSRIARDIHDQLGANLTQVALLGELVEGDKDSPAEVEGHARQISQTARETTRVLDEIVWAVNPSNDTLDGLVTYICKYTQEYLTVAGLHYRLDVPDQLPSTPIPPEVRHNVFLVCKEAVTNIVRHAKASAAWVRLQIRPDSFTIKIEDNGRGLAGLDKKAAQTRNGLRNMRKRMEEIGGEFALEPSPEGGTQVRLTAPLGQR
jgi:ligand-binding sensor domain-containing protein/signal transduction histidine kinase